MRALVPAAGFASAMDAVRSNKQLGEGITLFLERPGAADGSSGGESQGDSEGGSKGGSEGGSSGGGGGAAGEGTPPAQGGVFDPALFDE
jgi:hypothetical protein